MICDGIYIFFEGDEEDVLRGFSLCLHIARKRGGQKMSSISSRQASRLPSPKVATNVPEKGINKLDFSVILY